MEIVITDKTPEVVWQLLKKTLSRSWPTSLEAIILKTKVWSMAKVRCKRTWVDTFFGKFLYDQKVSRNHFLWKIKEVVDWDKFTRKPLGYYQGKGEIGQAPYYRTIMLRMSLTVDLAYWQKQSDMVIQLFPHQTLILSICHKGIEE